MKAKVLLRIASLLITIHLLGHLMGHLSWQEPEDPQMKEVVATMQGYSAEFMGATKSMADYYNGYSTILFFVYAMTISILWSISNFINIQNTIAIRILYPIGVSYIAFGVIEYIYFFPFAASMSFLAGVLALWAIAAKK
jgi:hypothetical protein